MRSVLFPLLFGLVVLALALACTRSPSGTPTVAPGSIPPKMDALHDPDAGQAVLWSDEFQSERWMHSWHVTRVHWGTNNMKVESDVTGAFAKILRVDYPQGSASPAVTRNTGAPVGGAQFYADLGLVARDSLHLRYYVRFAEGHQFVKGGKLPGLYGGAVHSGGRIPDGTNGFSTRYMWRRAGDGEVYAYLPTSVEFGTSLGRGTWRFEPGRWYLLEQAVKLNTPGEPDGSIRAWVDEKLVLDASNLMFRTVDSLRIEGIYFSTFFGGGDPTWATPKDTWIDFARFAVGEEYIGR